MTGINILMWIMYGIGVMVAMVLYIDDAYEESWQYNMLPQDYVGQKEVLTRIILFSIGSWIAVLHRWIQKKC
jgi:hypothetical protein